MLPDSAAGFAAGLVVAAQLAAELFAKKKRSPSWASEWIM